MSHKKKNAMINVRLDETLKVDATNLFADLGLSMSSAVTLFLHTCIRENGIPFPLNLDKDNADSE